MYRISFFLKTIFLYSHPFLITALKKYLYKNGEKKRHLSPKGFEGGGQSLGDMSPQKLSSFLLTPSLTMISQKKQIIRYSQVMKNTTYIA